jgi:hypothetical protein
MRRLIDNMKTKAEGDEIDSLSTLINELYDKITELERGGSPAVNDKGPSVSSN